MTLPSSGSISSQDINVELGRVATAPFSLQGTEERALAGVPSGSISFSDFYGKSVGVLSSIQVRSISGVTGGFGCIGADTAYGPVGSMSPKIYKGVKILSIYSAPDGDFSRVTREYVGNLVNYLKPSLIVKGFQGYSDYRLDAPRNSGAFVIRATVLQTDEPSDAKWVSSTDTEATITNDLNLLFCSSFMSGNSTLYSGFAAYGAYGQDTFNHTEFYLGTLLYKVLRVYTSSTVMSVLITAVGHSRLFEVGDFSLISIQQTSWFSPAYPLGQKREYLPSEINSSLDLGNGERLFNFNVKERLNSGRPFDIIIQPSISVGSTPQYNEEVSTFLSTTDQWGFSFTGFEFDKRALIINDLTYLISSLAKNQSGEIIVTISDNGNPPLSTNDLIIQIEALDAISTFGVDVTYNSGAQETTFIIPPDRCAHINLSDGVDYQVKIKVK